MEYEKQVENAKKRISRDERFTQQNRELILKFIETCRSKNLSPQRIMFYFCRLNMICLFHRKDFRSWDKSDVEICMRHVYQRGYKPWTIEAFKITLKVFFRWMHGLDRSDPTPKLVSWLTRETPQNQLRKEDLLTREEINRMINATNNLEYKSMIAILAAGTRPSELFSITIDDVRDEGDYIKIYVRGKMHKKMGERSVFIGFFIKDHEDIIRLWLKEHPNRHDKTAKLFPHVDNWCLRMRIKRITKCAGLKKKVWPYLFRHTFGTWAYGSYEGSYARRLLGHAAGSKMEGVYCHLSESDLVERLLDKKPIEGGKDIIRQDTYNDIWSQFEAEIKEEMKPMFIEWMKKRNKDT